MPSLAIVAWVECRGLDTKRKEAWIACRADALKRVEAGYLKPPRAPRIPAISNKDRSALIALWRGPFVHVHTPSMRNNSFL